MSEQPLSERFVFWLPPAGFTIPTGSDATPFQLPSIPLPLNRSSAVAKLPSATEIGESVYDYLRQFPDCPHNRSYAELLRDGYPHYIADIGAHAAMLQHKDVSAAYVERMINQLKILALLDPSNPGLLQQIGIAYFDLAMTFEQLPACRSCLLKALGYFTRAVEFWPEQPANLSHLGQINYLLGDYPAAKVFWQKLLGCLDSPSDRATVESRIHQIQTGETPDYPLIDDLEMVGQALIFCGSSDFVSARRILEDVEQKGWLAREFCFAEFYYLLGLCCYHTDDLPGAVAGYTRALEIDPTLQPATDGLAIIQTGER